VISAESRHHDDRRIAAGGERRPSDDSPVARIAPLGHALGVSKGAIRERWKKSPGLRKSSIRATEWRRRSIFGVRLGHIWWSGLERIFMAVDGLDCAELLR